MKRRLFLLVAASAITLGVVVPVPTLAQGVAAATPARAEIQRWERMAQSVDIIRDDWGIAHVKGRTDAEAVFGMIYAQAEDDFNRIETNYLVALGRLAEAQGEEALWKDLRQRLFVDPATLQADYAKSPPWLQKLMTAWADGLNTYLRTHPQVHPKVLTKFEPWMALSFTEGSIGGDIERVALPDLQAFYDRKPGAQPPAPDPTEPPQPDQVHAEPQGQGSGQA